MGDIADGLIDGTFDSITGEYLGEGPGYPRTHQKDHGVHYYEKKETSQGQKYRGVIKWLENNNIKKPYNELLKQFMVEEQPHVNLNRHGSDRSKMIHISGFCFNEFINWIKKNQNEKT